jgi:adenylate cyclase
MSDIFISYSRKDSVQALELAEKLRAAGASVWIDQFGIEAASSWSKEIVQAIKDSKVFVILLSRHSLASHNVIKELSIASERQKLIVPVEVEAVHLTDDFEYQLAGLQRVSVRDQDAILRVVMRHVDGAAPKPAMIAAPTIIRSRKLKPLIAVPIAIAIVAIGAFLWLRKGASTYGEHAIMVVPFSDLSQQQDTELVITFSNDLRETLKAERKISVIPRSISSQFTGTTLGTDEIAKELEARYAVEGSLLSEGDSLFVEVRLRDCRELIDVTRTKYKAVLRDVFDLHSRVSEDIHAALLPRLSKE